MDSFKEQTFSQNHGSVRDIATGKKLYATQSEAQSRAGENWAQYAAETDHTIPLEKLHAELKDNPFLTDQDIREMANMQDNLQVISKTVNASKGKKTNYELTEHDSSKLGITSEGAQKLREQHDHAESAIRREKTYRTVKNAASTFHNAGMSAAKAAGTQALAMSGVMNITAVIKGEKSAGDAIVDTIKDGGAGAATGYIMGGGLTTLAQGLSNSSSKIIQSFVKSNVPAQIITGITVIGSSLKRFASGEINTREFLLELGDKGMNFASMSYGFAVGQAIIPIPVLGGVIGSLVGSALTSGLMQNLVEALQRKELEHQERLRLIAEYNEAVKQEKIFRADLEKFLSQYFREYKTFFYDSISAIHDAFISDDADGVIAGANAITRKLGGNVQYETVDEFRNLLESGAVFSW